MTTIIIILSVIIIMLVALIMQMAKAIADANTFIENLSERLVEYKEELDDLKTNSLNLKKHG